MESFCGRIRGFFRFRVHDACPDRHGEDRLRGMDCRFRHRCYRPSRALIGVRLRSTMRGALVRLKRRRGAARRRDVRADGLSAIIRSYSPLAWGEMSLARPSRYQTCVVGWTYVRRGCSSVDALACDLIYELAREGSVRRRMTLEIQHTTLAFAAAPEAVSSVVQS